MLSYKTGLDSTVFESGEKSAFFESLENNVEGFYTIMQ